MYIMKGGARKLKQRSVSKRKFRTQPVQVYWMTRLNQHGCAFTCVKNHIFTLWHHIILLHASSWLEHRILWDVSYARTSSRHLFA